MLMSSIRSLTPQLRFNPLKPNIENTAFKLHYRVTVIMLIVFVVLVCSREYFGEHIRCLVGDGLPAHVVQTYCFFMATFTIVRNYNESMLEAGALPHPGVGPYEETDEVLHHKYYQWVPFVLLFQLICFYLPHYIWKKKEGGRIKALVDGLQRAGLSIQEEDMVVNGNTIPSRKSIKERLDIVRRDIILRLRITRTWSTWLVSMEVLNLVNVMLQIWLTDKFLNGAFIGLGPKVLDKTWDYIADPLESVFPKVTKCTFHKYGSSGSIQKHDALCVMALNIIHEKIYTVLWFWFLFLFIVSVLALLWRMLTYYMYRRSLRFNEVVLRYASTGKFNPYNIVRVVNGCAFEDWLFLYYLGKNMDGVIYQELFKNLAEDLQKREVTTDVDDDEKGSDPVLVATMNYDDETLPLKSGKMS